MNKDTIVNYYDKYVKHQSSVGINARHKKIQFFLEKFGLKPHHQVLEIGCGIGTITELIARYLNDQGGITAVDISPKSIAQAKERLSVYSNVSLQVIDFTQTHLQQKFDFIVMPDVIEHIPLERHADLFAHVSNMLPDDGTILIHLPNPYYLAWCHQHRPDLLQVIDQPIYTDQLLENCYPAGLYLYYLETYSIWVAQGDYQLIVLKPVSAAPDFSQTIKPGNSLWSRLQKGITAIWKK